MSCFSLLCDPVGRIDAILDDGADALPADATGTMLGSHLAATSVAHFYELLVEVEERGALCDWRLSLRGRIGAEQPTYWVSAAREERLILLVGRSVSATADRAAPVAIPAHTEAKRTAQVTALAERIAQRHSDPDAVQSDLRLQLAAAQRLNAAPERFENELVRMAAHDLRNPLLVVSMNNSFLLDQCSALGLGDAERAMLADSVAMCQFMARFLDSMRHLAGVTVGHFALRREDCDVTAAVRAVVAGSARGAEQADIAVAVSRADSVQMAIDRGKLTFALHQLIGNSLKFCPAGSSVDVSVERRSVSSGRDEVEIAVTDDGPGIAPELQDKLFQPFGKPRPCSDGSEQIGSGVGLAIVRRIAEAHGGRVAVDSEAGRGTRVAIIMPAIGQPIATE
ncbi:MAG: HAMP domain-containing sensor histidine kinase [Myxococcota bacterium]